MKNTRSIDTRLGKVLGLLERFAFGDFNYRESYDENGDEVDEIIRRLNGLGEMIRLSGKVISDYEQRVTAIMNVLLKYTLFDFSEKAEVSEIGDEIDAIALALNTLGDELRDKIEAEKNYNERVRQLAVVMETTADAIVALDANGVITNCNKSAEKIYGYKSEDIKGKHVSRVLFNPDDLSDFEKLMDRVKRGEQVLNHETERTQPGGAVVEISLNLTPVYNKAGVLDSISVVARDITEQKRSERELRHSEERFRSLIEGVKDYAIIMLDASGLISSWNAGARALHGFEEREVAGQHFSIFFSGEEKKSHIPAHMLKEALRNGKSVRDHFMIRKDGGSFWANVLVTCLRDNEQHVTGFSLITRDLTESKRKDEAITLYTRELEQKNVELERINKELSSFTYISSHDLQEPLRKIRTLTSRLLQTDYDNLSEGGKDYFRRMENSAQRMQNLIRDIIDYTSLSAADSKCEECDLMEILNEVKENFREELASNNAVLNIGPLCNAEVIPAQFKHLMRNLIGNSLKFASEKRTPVISIKSTSLEHPPQGMEAMPEAKKYCLIEVQDNGIGFEPHFSRQIFEVFQRLHSHDLYPGTGIGLAICKKIVENHRGIIEAHGELGKGTLIRICLPVMELAERAN